MTRLIGAEVFKLRTTRTFYGLIAGALGLVLLIVILASATAGKTDITLRDVLNIGNFAQIFALLIGIIAVTSEFRHGTVTPSLLILPDRAKLTLAKLGASVIVGLLLGLVAYGLAALIGSAILSARDIPKGISGSRELDMVVGGVLAAGLNAALGVGVGAVVRNQVGAIVGSLLYLLILENLLTLIHPLQDPLAKFGFGGVSTGLTAGADPGAKHAPLDQLPAGLVFALYCAIFLVIGIWLMRRRDVTA